MKSIFILYVLLGLLSNFTFNIEAHAKVPEVQFYPNKDSLRIYGINVQSSNLLHLINLQRWLDKIFSTPKGYETLHAIQECGSRVKISHNQLASAEAGRTVSVASSNLWNGQGVPVEIYLNLEMPDDGEYLVWGKNYSKITFTADENLFHELAHARHKSCGTENWRDPESQAMIDENLYRTDIAELEGRQADQRSRVGIIGLK